MNVLSRIEQTLLVCDFLRGWALLELVAQLDALGGDGAERDRDVGRSTLPERRHQFFGEDQGAKTQTHPPFVIAVASLDVGRPIHASPPVADPRA